MAVFAAALFAAGILVALLILLFFCQIFIGKQKKRTAIERSLGMSKAKCTLSLLSGIIVIVLAGSISGSAFGYYMTGGAMDLFENRMQQETFSTKYSSWADSADKNLEVRLDDSSNTQTTCVSTGALVVILSLGIAVAMIQGNLNSEPLKLLSMREA